MDIAERISQLCKARHISIYKLADLSCLTQSTLQNIVSNRNNDVMVGTIEKICNGLGISLAEFFAEEAEDELPFEAKQKLKEYEKFLRHEYKKK